MKALVAMFVAAAALAAAGAHAETGHAGDAMTARGIAPNQGRMVDADVRKVDKAAGKVTLAHGPLANLDMPAMTMVFRVKDAAWLDRMKAGDKIRFMAERVDGAVTVVHFEPTQ